MRTVDIYVKNQKGKCPYAVFGRNTYGTRAMRNTTTFYIRNTMTGLKKKPEERTDNEKEVLHHVFTGIQAANARKLENFHKKMDKFAAMGGLKGRALLKKALSDSEPLPSPTAEKWMLSYEQLDAIFRCTHNPVYYSMTSQVNQQAIKKSVSSWVSYFKALKDWRIHPEKYEEKPGIPGYIRTAESTAHFTKQVAKPAIEDGILYLKFTNYGLYRIGEASILPGELVKTEIKPYCGGYKLLLTYKDGFKTPELPNEAKAVLGIDPGTSNFLSCAASIKAWPFIIDGHWLKSINQWFNKERARLTSGLAKGEDSPHSVKHSKRLDALSRRRDNLLREFFYKAAHYIFRWCKKHGIDVIVIGHNEGQKQETNIGKENNQNFVSIPMCRFIQALQAVSAKYGIPVVVREESYTSQASLLDMDPIPTYGVEDGIPHGFSGKRVKRGMYRSSDGTELNADINAAGNIARKEYPDAFAGADRHYMAETVQVVRREDLTPGMKKPGCKTGHKQKKSVTSLLRHETRKQIRRSYTEMFDVERGKPHKKTKLDYIEEAKTRKALAASA